MNAISLMTTLMAIALLAGGCESVLVREQPKPTITRVMFPGDGGSICFLATREDGQPIEFCLSQRVWGPEERKGRLYIGAHHFRLQGARMVPIGSEDEHAIVQLIERAIEPYMTPNAITVRTHRRLRDEELLQQIKQAHDIGRYALARSLIAEREREGISNQDYTVEGALAVIERVKTLRWAKANGIPFKQINPQNVYQPGRKSHPSAGQ